MKNPHQQLVDWYESEIDRLRYAIKMERGKTEAADEDNDRLRGLLRELHECGAVTNWMRVSDDLRGRVLAAVGAAVQPEEQCGLIHNGEVCTKSIHHKDAHGYAVQPAAVRHQFGDRFEDYIEDGFGNSWPKCKPDCRMEVVRPGKVQCDCSTVNSSQPSAARDEADELLVAIGLDPERYRTECGFLNLPKIKAALKYPDWYPRLADNSSQPPVSLCKFCGSNPADGCPRASGECLADKLSPTE